MTSVFLVRLGPSMTPLSFSRRQMVREASLTEGDLVEVEKCRRGHNRLGFAYQIGFVRLFNRFPAQQPLEICDELLSFVAMQLNIDATGIDGYAARQHTVRDPVPTLKTTFPMPPGGGSSMFRSVMLALLSIVAASGHARADVT